VFEGDGVVNEYVGGYQDWLRQRLQVTTQKPLSSDKAKAKKPAGVKPEPASKPKKRSYKDQRELDMLPERIEALEGELEQLQQQLADPQVYAEQGAEGLAMLGERLKEAEDELEQCYARWEALE